MPSREFGFRSLNGNFRFVFIGRVKQDINAIDLPLYGHLHLFRNLRYWRQNVEPGVKTCQDFISHYQQNLTAQSALEKQVIEAIKLTSARLQNHADVSCRIVLRRPGELILSHLTPKRSEFLEMQEDLRVYANVDISDIIAAQFYYFLRDISHTHQHHHRNTDTILSAYKSTNDINWRKNVLFSLYNHIIARKRTASLSECVDALGILAYARAFYQSSRNRLVARNLWAANEANFPTFLDEPLTESINAAIRQLENQDRAKYERRQALWHRKIGWLGVLIAVMTLLYEFGGHEAIENARMACYVKVGRTNLFAVIWLLLPIYIFVSILGGTRDVLQWRWIRSIIRITMAFPRPVSIGLFLAIGAVVPFAWNYLVNATIESGATIESAKYLLSVITAFLECQ